MFKRLMTMLLLVIMGSLLVIPAQAADTTWTAWLYESENGQITQVDDGGTALQVLLLPAETSASFSQNVAISADGVLLAYASSTATATSVQVYNLATKAVVYNLSLPANTVTSLDFTGNAFNFSEDSGTFAFGYAVAEVGWQIAVVDMATFSTLTLKEGDAAVMGFGTSNGFMLPDILSNRVGNVGFIMIPLGTDGRASYDGFIWNMPTNSVNPTDLYMTPDNDILAQTGEMITTLSDGRFPDSSEPLNGYPVNNTLRVFEPASGIRSIVTSFAGIYNARFIQGGERVGFIQYQTTGAGDTIQAMYVLERSGAIAGPVQGAANITSVAGVLNGFLFTQGSYDATSSTTLYYAETRAASGLFSGVSVWSSAVGVNARLVWVSDSDLPSSGTFSAWGRIEPVAEGDGPGVSIDTGVPVGDSAYAVGVTAQVQTSDNDVLNMRSGPGLNFAKIGTLTNGTMVTLVEGPNDADGFTWWHVRLASGVEGWVVSQADGINTLLPQ